MRRRFQCWAWRAAVCLTLGLVTTVAVAWGSAMYVPRPSGGSREVLSARSGQQLAVEYRCAGGARRHWSTFPAGIALRENTASKLPMNPPDTPTLRRDWGRLPLTPMNYDPRTGPDFGLEDARGWPALALWCTVEWQPPAAVGATGGVLVSPAGTDGIGARVLPLRPIWSGMLINTAVYALAWAGLRLVPGWARRSHRRWRGRCVGCGYERRGLASGAACPECGSPEGARA